MNRRLFFIAFMLMICIGAGVRVSPAKAASKYKIKVNKQCCTVTIYKKVAGKYKAKKAMICSAGNATPIGTFRLGEKSRWHYLMGPSYGQYCCRITGSILFHSVWYYSYGNKKSQSSVEYNKLGTLASHGCVRLTVADSKWIYDHIPSGTSVVIYNSSKPGPLGKPKAIKVQGKRGWDPTDPDPSNPYKKKNPKIKGVKKNQNVLYGDKFKLMEGVSATNTTGFKATKLLKTTIYYKDLYSPNYKKVKKVNTKKIGQYKIVFRITDEIGHKASKKSIVKIVPEEYVQEIELNLTHATLYINSTEGKESIRLYATKILPTTATVKNLHFSSGDDDIATVSSDGVIRAVNPGECHITVRATDGSGIMEKCLVNVIGD